MSRNPGWKHRRQKNPGLISLDFASENRASEENGVICQQPVRCSVSPLCALSSHYCQVSARSPGLSGKLVNFWIKQIIGCCAFFLLHITIKLGRIFRIRSLSRPLNFLGCKHFWVERCWVLRPQNRPVGNSASFTTSTHTSGRKLNQDTPSLENK